MSYGMNFALRELHPLDSLLETFHLAEILLPHSVVPPVLCF